MSNIAESEQVLDIKEEILKGLDIHVSKTDDKQKLDGMTKFIISLVMDENPLLQFIAYQDSKGMLSFVGNQRGGNLIDFQLSILERINKRNFKY